MTPGYEGVDQRVFTGSFPKNASFVTTHIRPTSLRRSKRAESRFLQSQFLEASIVNAAMDREQNMNALPWPLIPIRRSFDR